MFGWRGYRNISEWDATCEGVKGLPVKIGGVWAESCKLAFKDLWETIYPGSWDRNDWVFVYDFERTKAP